MLCDGAVHINFSSAISNIKYLHQEVESWCETSQVSIEKSGIA